MTKGLCSTSALLSRRDFVRAGTVATLATAVPLTLARGMRASKPLRNATAPDVTSQLADPDVMKDLVLRAIDAARTAGARYAEARVTRTVSQSFIGASLEKDREYYAIGVRVLVNGAWGFAASPYLEQDEAVALAQGAVAQARINAAVFPHEVELGTYPIAKGAWVTPIRIDPFQISLEEKFDFVRSFDGLVPRRIRGRRILAGMQTMGFSRQERTVATSEGALFTQTLYVSGGKFPLTVFARVNDDTGQEVSTGASGRGIFEAGQGWERLLNAGLREQIPQLIEEAESGLFLPRKPVDVGRYEMVLSAPVVASMIASTLGDATQLDRALGYEANAGGTSYLGPDPQDYLGTRLGSSLLTVHGDRSLPTGLATVKWDDEGVLPESFPLVNKGVFTDYQTTREQASWLSSWYQSKQRPIRSHGCSVAPSASDFPLQHTPNLLMTPGASAMGFDEMVQNTKKGIAFVGGEVGTDFQSRTGQSGGSLMREIVDGKLGPILEGAQILFDSTELWKNLIEIGGKDNTEITPSYSRKGQPAQGSSYTISAVPARMKEMTVIDGSRKV